MLTYYVGIKTTHRELIDLNINCDSAGDLIKILEKDESVLLLDHYKTKNQGRFIDFSDDLKDEIIRKTRRGDRERIKLLLESTLLNILKSTEILIRYREYLGKPTPPNWRSVDDNILFEPIAIVNNISTGEFRPKRILFDPIGEDSEDYKKLNDVRRKFNLVRCPIVHAVFSPDTE